MRAAIGVLLATAACAIPKSKSYESESADAPLETPDTETADAKVGPGLDGAPDGHAPDAHAPDAPGAPDAPLGWMPDGSLRTGYTVYANGDHTLYTIDLQQKTLQTVGPFDAPLVAGKTEDIITDLAVTPDDTIYAISATALYTASPTDGHVTLLGPISACGAGTVALTATLDGKLWAGDYTGNLCEIDLTTSPPTMKPPIAMPSGVALVGDLVAIGDGTVYGTADLTGDATGTGTQLSNLLVTMNLTTGAVTQIGGGTGFPKLYGVSYAQGEVFGFTHDRSGDVVAIDPATGVGTLFATFTDPSNLAGISFGGAGVNPLVH